MARRIVVVEVPDRAVRQRSHPSPGIPEGDRWCVVPVAWGATQSLRVADVADRAQAVLRERPGEPVDRRGWAVFAPRMAQVAVALAGAGEPIPGLAVRQRAVEVLEAVRAPSGTGSGRSGAPRAVLERSGGLVEVLETWPWGAGGGAVVEDRPWSAGIELGGCLPVRWRGVRPGVPGGHATWRLGQVGQPDWAGTAAASRMVADTFGWTGIPLMADWDEIAGWLPPKVGRTATAWVVPCPDLSQRVTAWAFAWRVARTS